MSSNSLHELFCVQRDSQAQHSTSPEACLISPLCYYICLEKKSFTKKKKTVLNNKLISNNDQYSSSQNNTVFILQAKKCLR